jgi:hypothetical protein
MTVTGFKNSELSFWVMTAAAIASPVISVMTVYFGLKMEIQDLKNTISSHENTTQLVMKQAESIHSMFAARISSIEIGEKEIESFIAMAKVKLNLQ